MQGRKKYECSAVWKGRKGKRFFMLLPQEDAEGQNKRIRQLRQAALSRQVLCVLKNHTHHQILKYTRAYTHFCIFNSSLRKGRISAPKLQTWCPCEPLLSPTYRSPRINGESRSLSVGRSEKRVRTHNQQSCEKDRDRKSKCAVQ